MDNTKFTSEYNMIERRLPTVNKPPTAKYYEPNVSFMERWRLFQEEKKATGGFTRMNKWFNRFIVIFQIPAHFYVFFSYILPHYFVDGDPFALYYAKVISTYFGVMVLANWFCVILVDTSFSKTKDSPYLKVNHHGDQTAEHFPARIHESVSNNNRMNGHCVFDMSTDDDALPWHYCERCAMHVPYRVHHCNICKNCIIKRDHHWFIIGTCIGYKNERYFIVLLFHTIIVGIIGGCLTVNYMYSVIWADIASVFDLVFPVTIIRCMNGNLSAFNCLIITQVYIEFLFGIVCFFYFIQQIYLNIKGKTLYEHMKQLPVRNTNNFNQNMKSVFGDFWVLNFIVPMTVVFRQHDGVAWNSVKLTSIIKSESK